MKTKITLLAALFSFNTNAQSLTYANFSASLTATLSVKLADNASFNSSLLTTTGTGVTWDASGLTQASGTPIVNFSYGLPSATPQGSLFPNSNYAYYDPALTSFIEIQYYAISADSISKVGSYAADAEHEIYQDGDTEMRFPLNLNESFTDTYEKTNYSDATTVSSHQTGSRTVTYVGYGTLILPQGTVTGVAMIKEIRTNSLGPNSSRYTWCKVSDGQKLMMRGENDGSVNTAWNAATIATGTSELTSHIIIQQYPNPAHADVHFTISGIQTSPETKVIVYNELGEEVCRCVVVNNQAQLNLEGLSNGFYFYSLTSNNTIHKTGKLIIQ